jgi:AraC-like DNA-binding protein
MLYETDDHISTIAFASGFNNLANFNRQFVKLKGVTPREYRQTAYKGLISE